MGLSKGYGLCACPEVIILLEAPLPLPGNLEEPLDSLLQALWTICVVKMDLWSNRMMTLYFVLYKLPSWFIQDSPLKEPTNTQTIEPF